jgi:hypothetical protein
MRRGRQFELDRMQAGSAQILLNNQDRRFDPNHAGSPYFGGVLPRRRLRIQATWNSITYPVFSGYVEDWPQAWENNGRVASVSLTVSDGFAVFGQMALNVSYGAELSSARVSNVLDSVGWPSGAGNRTIGTGFAHLQASVLVNTTALEHLLSVATSENGFVFMGRDGSATFIGRNYGGYSSLATFGDGAGELPYSDLTLGTAPIWNDVRLTATGGIEQAALDATSITQFFQSSKIESQYLQDEDNDLQALADWYLFKFRNPQQRVTSMVVSPSRDPNNLWPQVLGREIGDHITINRRPPGGGSVISQPSVIEGIEHTASNHEWTTQFSLSPAEPVSAFMIVGTGAVGTGVVGY